MGLASCAVRPVRGRSVWFVALALAGCAPGSSARESRLRNLASDSDPAVAALSVHGAYVFCSATLISRHTLLTVGDCSIAALGDLEAQFGSDADKPTQTIPIVGVSLHAEYTAAGKLYELAVMQLARDPDGIAPVPLNATPLTDDDVGREIRHVGFAGVDSVVNDGIKRTVSYVVESVEAGSVEAIASGKDGCLADPGGPALATRKGQTTETVIGVVSSGPGCDPTEKDESERVDVAKPWIIEAVSARDEPPIFGDGENGSGTLPGPGGEGSGRGGSSGTAIAGCAAAPGAGGALWLVVALAWLRRRRVTHS